MRPKYNVCYGIEGEGKKTRWRTVGSAWEHKKDGKVRIDVTIDALPINFTGKLCLFEIIDDGRVES